MKTVTLNKQRGGNGATTETRRHLLIPSPRFAIAMFHVVGTSPLVIHRFSEKAKRQLGAIQEGEISQSAKRKRTAVPTDELFNDARYISKEGWDGLQAGSIRNAMISACRLVNFPMTRAKLSIFVIADGWDRVEPQIPLLRIYGKPVKQEDMARVANGNPYVTVRPAYHDWMLKIRIRWDLDQFTLMDVASLLTRVGEQVGIGEGRPDSKNSCGMGWGLFSIAKKEELKK